MKRILIALLTVAVIGGILFSGCVAAPSAAPPPVAPAPPLEPTPEPTPEAPDTAPELTPELTPIPMPTNPNSVFITYHRSGGIMGLRDHLTIYADGRCELQRIGVEREFTIQPSQLEHLKELMEEANFLDLEGTHGPPPGADFFEYVISCYAGEGRMKTVVAWTSAIPDALQPILHELNQLISSNS